MQEPNRPGAPLAIWAAAVFLIAALWTARLHFIEVDRVQAIDSAQREHANLAFTLAEHNSRALRNAETALRNAAREWEEGRWPAPRQRDSGRLVGRMLLIGVDGQARAEDGLTLDASQREYFLAHRDDRSQA